MNRYNYVIYIVFITTLIVNSIDLTILLFICPLKRNLCSSIISKRYLYIAVFMILFIVFNKTIDLYISKICFVFCNLSDLIRIMISTLYRCFRKYLYIKLIFVILIMIVIKDLSYIFRNSIKKKSFSGVFHISV